MAEFQKVMKQAKRMCEAHICCHECPLNGIERANGVNKTLRCVAAVCDDEVERLEQIVMDWAEKHPEPRYPTWKEWQDMNFPNNDSIIRPCIFESEEYFNCKQEIGCEKCINKPIPSDIAEKLGIKPIGGNDDA